MSDAVEQDHYLKELAKLTNASLEAIRAKFSAEKVEKTPLRKARSKPVKVDPGSIEQQRLQDHLLSMALMQPKIRPIVADCRPEYFTNDASIKILEFLTKHPDFKDEPQLAKELQEVSDYVKILVLQFEELYEDLPLDELKEQARRLKHRLIAGYVKIQKRQLVEKMHAVSDEKELKKLIQKVDKLNKLIVEV